MDCVSLIQLKIEEAILAKFETNLLDWLHKSMKDRNSVAVVGISSLQISSALLVPASSRSGRLMRDN